MPRRDDIAISDLLLDPANARLDTVQSSQQGTALALASQQGKRLVKLAASILEKQLDPSQLPIVLVTGDRRRKYTVLEGNRRVLAVKALETPSLVAGALAGGDYKKLQALALKYTNNPIDEITCVIYDEWEADDAYDRVMNRHTGAQDGEGMVEWGSDEKNRFSSRHGRGRKRTMAGQALDFLEAVDGPTSSKAQISTTLERLLGSPEVREKLGVDRVSGVIVSNFPREEIAKGLRKVVEDLRSGTITVPDVYTAEQRREYAETIKGRNVLPKKTTKLKDPIKLDDLTSGTKTPSPVKPKKKATAKAKAPRTTVAEASAQINPTPPRINAVFNELANISADQYPNAGAVLLRVFLELSVDDYIVREKLMGQAAMNNAVLAKRIKAVVDDLEKKGEVTTQLKKAVYKIADSQHTIAASVVAFHQYVHNQYVHPKPSELRTSWNELQPFLEAIWK